MKVPQLIALLQAQDQSLDVRLSAFSPVTGIAARPLYDAGAPYTPDPQPVGEYLELLPDGLADGAGC